MEKYDFKSIEKKWQDKWDETEIYKVSEDKSKKKFYSLVEFPYPSGEGLHVGHVKGHTAVDIFSRFKRMQGYNVLCPMGWDAFGLPAENFAIKNKQHPATFTQKNIANFKRQIKSFGPSFDWSKEIDTTDPEYYKWTQWIFLELFKAGLAYEKEAPINWCPSCKTGLANEEVVDGLCERCDTQVVQKNMKQWYLKITDYAEKLIDDLKDVNWPEYIKTSQKNWIGKSEGTEFKMQKSDDSTKNISVYTTRIDTVFGMTYAVMAPDHSQVLDFITEGQKKSCLDYIESSKKKSAMERTELNKDKTGVFSGSYVINPFNGKEIPVYIGDYVLGNYGTGAVMAVPAHDERDFEFAKKYNLEIIPVIVSDYDKIGNPNALIILDDGYVSTIGELGGFQLPFCSDGYLINSSNENLNNENIGVFKFDGNSSEVAREKMTKWLEEKGIGTKKINYKLRDWLFARQRYRGEPIPIIKCEKCGLVPVPENELPLLLPEVEDYEPTGTGESPLASIDSFVNTTCPKCGILAKRETNTMPQWAGSSWYFLRYIDPKNSNEIASKENLEYFMPVDIYFGGAEHTTVHLLYSRFWNKALFDRGIVPVSEPYKRRVQHGLIAGEDGRKMSKRWGNVINPDDVIKEYGADTMRTYIMFMGPYGDSSAWSTSAINGVHRFLNKVWLLQNKKITDIKDDELEVLMHKTIKKVTDDIEQISYHTALSQMMILLNMMTSKENISKVVYENFLKLLSPFAPHITEELWQNLGNTGSIHLSSWPAYDSSKLVDKIVKIVIQINGKVRDEIEVELDTSEEDIRKMAFECENVKKYIDGVEIKKMVYVKNKLLSIVI
ncbi:leucine--tRNA ligase [Candidatus Gracilibacteria bacterium]|nr:leucine--tRNA ligase [Candidatus Gracilibacteria bacterium]